MIVIYHVHTLYSYNFTFNHATKSSENIPEVMQQKIKSRHKLIHKHKDEHLKDATLKTNIYRKFAIRGCLFGAELFCSVDF